VYAAGNPVRWSDPSGHVVALETSLTTRSAVRNGVVVGLVGSAARYLLYRATAALILAPIYGDLIGDLLEGTANELQRLIESVLSGEITETITRTGEATRVRQGELEPENRFNLAFGIDDYLVDFAASFTDRPTYWWIEWPNFMVLDENNNIFLLSDKGIFKSAFATMMAAYFIAVPDGKLRFNLYGLRYGFGPDSLTIWELDTISTLYLSRAEFYVYDGVTRRRLRGNELNRKLDEILIGS